MTDKHTSETHYLSLKEMVKSYAQSKWLYFNRAVGGYCHHCVIDGNIDAGAAASKETGQGRRVSIEPETMVYGLGDVLERVRWLVSSRLGAIWI
jgi:hypothetical protein